MSYINIKIKDVNGTLAAGAVFLRHESIPTGEAPLGGYEERLLPEQVVRVPEAFAIGKPYLEITLERPNRPVHFLSEQHAEAWVRPHRLLKQGIPRKRLFSLRTETLNQMIQQGEDELVAKRPQAPKETPAPDAVKVESRRKSA